MKPLMMKFRQGKGEHEQDIFVNMSLVCTIASDGSTGSVLTFAAAIGDEAAYIVVNETPDEIEARSELHR
jgi:hypothetical protein